MNTQTGTGTKTLPMDQYMTTREAAELLRVTTRTIAAYMAKGILPYIKLPGGTVRFKKSSIEQRLAEFSQN